MGISDTYHALVALIKNLQQTIAELVKENAALKARIDELEHPKNSNNSSVPPRMRIEPKRIKVFVKRVVRKQEDNWDTKVIP